MRRLDGLIRWFQGSVVAPHERDRRLAPARAHVLPSKTLTAAQRIGIYADAYLARLIEALHEDFPALSRLLGHGAFHRLCRAYLERYPSRSWSLNPLGRRLPDFLSGPVRVPRRAACLDLARLEAAHSEVFDAEGVEPLKPGDFARLPASTLGRRRLNFVPAFRLLALDHAANPYLDAVREERKPLPPLRRKRSWIAVYRKEYRVWRLDLDEGGHAALSALLRGRTIEEAVSAAARVWKGEPGELQARIRRGFGEWVSEGFFASLR